MSRPILCLDFDGVLHSYASGWKGATEIPDPPFPGAIEFLREATNHFNVQIFSSRSNMEGGIPAMLAWIERWARLTYGDKDLAWLSRLHYPTIKPPAKVTIDDRAITFTGKWPSMAELKAFEPWYHPNKMRGSGGSGGSGGTSQIDITVVGHGGGGPKDAQR